MTMLYYYVVLNHCVGFIDVFMITLLPIFTHLPRKVIFLYKYPSKFIIFCFVLCIRVYVELSVLPLVWNYQQDLTRFNH